MITRQFEVYLNPSRRHPLTINVNQYDQGEKWVFTILNEDGTQYTPTTCAIVGRKSDGNGIAVNGTVENGKAVIMETEQMTASAGKAVFELSVDGLTHGTANFYVLVEKKPIEDAVMSDSDLSLIEEALEASSGFNFTITLEEFNGNLVGTCDHTAEEIYEAIENGERLHGTVLNVGYDSGRGHYVYESEINKYSTYVTPQYTTLYFYSASDVAYSNEYSVEQLQFMMFTVAGNMVQINKIGVKKVPDILYVDVFVEYENGELKSVNGYESWHDITEQMRNYKVSATIRYSTTNPIYRNQYPASAEWVQSFNEPVHFRSIVLDGQTLKEFHAQVTSEDVWSFEINDIGE